MLATLSATKLLRYCYSYAHTK